MAPKLREFDDIPTMRSSIMDRVMRSIQSKYPLENDRYRLELADLAFDREDPPTIAEQKRAIMEGQTLHRKLKGKWRLVDKATGQAVDERPTVVAHVPEVTNRGTFIYNGNEYTVANQMRLRPGVYTRRKESGELEAHFNLLPGSGKAFRVHMEPQTGIFKMQIGQSHVPMYPIMRALGVSDNDLQKQWGVDLLNANRSKVDSKAVQKVYDRMVTKKEPGEAPEQGIAREFKNMTMDPEIVANNLGNWLNPGSDDTTNEFSRK